MNKLKGVVTAMMTPFTPKGEIDFSKLKEIIEFYISKGVNGLFLLGTTGEMFKVTMEERKLLAEKVVKLVDKRISIFIHIGSLNFNETLELAKHSEAIGATGIAVITPVYFNADENTMKNYYEIISKSVSDKFPIYLYNIPQMSNNNLEAETVKYLFEKCENIIGIKYSYNNMLETYKYILINDSFSVLQGTDRCFLPALQIGCDGIVSGISSVYPELFVNIYKAFNNNDLKKAKLYQEIANEYAKILDEGKDIAIFKEALKYRGIDVGSVKKPQLNLSEKNVTTLRIQIDELNKKYNKYF